MGRHCRRPGRGRRPQTAIEFLDPAGSLALVRLTGLATKASPVPPLRTPCAKRQPAQTPDPSPPIVNHGVRRAVARRAVVAVRAATHWSVVAVWAATHWSVVAVRVPVRVMVSHSASSSPFDQRTLFTLLFLFAPDLALVVAFFAPV